MGRHFIASFIFFLGSDPGVVDTLHDTFARWFRLGRYKKGVATLSFGGWEVAVNIAQFASRVTDWETRLRVMMSNSPMKRDRTPQRYLCQVNQNHCLCEQTGRI
jgi:hypothetical protein